MSRRSVGWLAVSLLAVGVGVAIAQAGDTGGRASDDRPEPAPSEPRASDGSGTVSVPEPSTETLRYYRSGHVLWTIGLLWGLAVPLTILFTGFSGRIRDLASRLAGGRWLANVIGYVLLYSLLVFALDLPLAYYAGFVRPHAYELSNQSFLQWAADLFKGLGVGLGVASFFGWIPFLLIRRSPRRWWLWAGLGSLPFLVFMTLVTPIWIAPLFDDYSRLRDRELEAEILDLARRAGVDAERVWEVDKSVDTERVNAYVTGLAGTHRIVLWDTLLAKLAPDETLFVMGHELGHYVLGHIRRGILLGWLGILAGLYVVHRVARRLIRRFEDRFRFSRLADVASLPLIIVLFQIVSLAASPAALAYSRWQERQADRFGLELTRDNRAAALAFVKLQRENLTHPRPGPVYRFFRLSHPPLAERIEFANTYRPWEGSHEGPGVGKYPLESRQDGDRSAG